MAFGDAPHQLYPYRRPPGRPWEPTQVLIHHKKLLQRVNVSVLD